MVWSNPPAPAFVPFPPTATPPPHPARTDSERGGPARRGRTGSPRGRGGFGGRLQNTIPSERGEEIGRPGAPARSSPPGAPEGRSVRCRGRQPTEGTDSSILSCLPTPSPGGAELFGDTRVPPLRGLMQKSTTPRSGPLSVGSRPRQHTARPSGPEEFHAAAPLGSKAKFERGAARGPIFHTSPIAHPNHPRAISTGPAPSSPSHPPSAIPHPTSPHPPSPTPSPRSPPSCHPPGSAPSRAPARRQRCAPRRPAPPRCSPARRSPPPHRTSRHSARAAPPRRR